MAELALDLDEFCPSCGDWVEVLISDTGWCSECSLGHHPVDRQSYELFLECHADRIEILMYHGATLTSAIQTVRDEIRPNCVVCSEPIRGGKKGALFCKSHTHLWDRLRRYKSKGMNHNEALEKVLNAYT